MEKHIVAWVTFKVANPKAECRSVFFW